MIDRRLWSISVLVVVIVAIVIYLNVQPQLLAAFKNVPLSAVIYIIVLRLLFLATNGLFLRTFAAKFGVRLTLTEWVGIPIVTTMANYITPFSGGIVARAAYLKYRHAFPYTQFATLLASNYLVTFWVISTVGLVTLVLFVDNAQFFWQVTLFFLVIIVVISTLVFIPTIKLPWNHRLSKALNTALEGWTLVKNDWFLLAKLIAYTLINILLNGFSFWVAYRALGYSISFADALLIGLLAVFSILLNITPGNLGIQEAVVSLSSALLGTGMGQGLLAALLIRAATLVLAFTLGPIFSYLLTRDVVIHQSANLVEDISD